MDVSFEVRGVLVAEESAAPAPLGDWSSTSALAPIPALVIVVPVRGLLFCVEVLVMVTRCVRDWVVPVVVTLVVTLVVVLPVVVLLVAVFDVTVLAVVVSVVRVVTEVEIVLVVTNVVVLVFVTQT
mmetsp:Transcript_66650/g.156908  ORF Transcript_66650/g.156908 Transcript_66650/m.156908 type:complete len:126 (-) Transcript_66650:787-1164(-)